jgi:hypothetical protein
MSDTRAPQQPAKRYVSDEESKGEYAKASLPVAQQPACWLHGRFPEPNCTMCKAAPVAQQPAEPRRIWPFVESPGEFAFRLAKAHEEFGGDWIAAVRCVLIEHPAALAHPPAADNRLRRLAQEALAWMDSSATDKPFSLCNDLRDALAHPPAADRTRLSTDSEVVGSAMDAMDDAFVEHKLGVGE